jgi:hypothetical protein
MICTAQQILFGHKIEKNEIHRACRTMRKRTGLYGVLVAKPEGKRQFGSPRHR